MLGTDKQDLSRRDLFPVGGSIGFSAPHYGPNLCVASSVTGISYFRLLPYTVPYPIALPGVWIVVALVPELSTALVPNAGG